VSSFVKFLEEKAKRTRMEASIRGADARRGSPEQRLSPTEFIELYYLGVTPGETVVMSRSMARELEERLRRLEEENKRLREINDILKAASIGLLILLIAVVMILRGI